MDKYDTLPYALDYHNKKLELFSNEPIVKNKIIFAGCSITEFGKWNDLLNDSSIINRGIAGDNSFGLLNRIKDISIRKPSLLFLSIGINDISKNIPIQATADNIFNFIKIIKNDSLKTRIFVHSILPTNASNRDNKTEVKDHYNKNEKVIALNDELLSGSQSSSYTFIDIHNSFKDADGNLNTKFSEKDGLHLNSIGYNLWADILKRKILKNK
jgi:lysophospholipase L1-like esterase